MAFFFLNLYEPCSPQINHKLIRSQNPQFFKNCFRNKNPCPNLVQNGHFMHKVAIKNQTQFLSLTLDGTLSGKIYQFRAVNCQKIIKLLGAKYDFFTSVLCAQRKAENGLILYISIRMTNKLKSRLVVVKNRTSISVGQIQKIICICQVVKGLL